MGEMGKYFLHGHRPESNLDKELPAQMEGPGRVVLSNIRRARQATSKPSRRPVSQRCGERCTRLESATRAPSQISVKSLILGRNLPVQHPTDVVKTST